MTCLEKFQEKFGDNRNFNLSITAVMEFSVVHFAGKVRQYEKSIFLSRYVEVQISVRNVCCQSAKVTIRSELISSQSAWDMCGLRTNFRLG